MALGWPLPTPPPLVALWPGNSHLVGSHAVLNAQCRLPHAVCSIGTDQAVPLSFGWCRSSQPQRSNIQLPFYLSPVAEDGTHVRLVQQSSMSHPGWRERRAEPPGCALAACGRHNPTSAAGAHGPAHSPLRQHGDSFFSRGPAENGRAKRGQCIWAAARGAMHCQGLHSPVEPSAKVNRWTCYREEWPMAACFDAREIHCSSAEAAWLHG